MEEPIIYTEPGFVGMEKVFLADEEYARALESFIVPCADVLIIDKTERSVYLAKRKSKPLQNTWWMIGGRRKAGVSARDAMGEIFKRETSLELDPARFEFVAVLEYLLKDRAQLPEKNLHTQGVTYTIELTPEERAVVGAHLEPKEYYTELGLKSFTLTELQDGTHHPTIVDIAKKVLK